MTAYEFWMPVVLLAIGWSGVLYMRHESKKLDARLEAARQQRRRDGRR